MYPMTTGLLISMAYRVDHSYGVAEYVYDTPNYSLVSARRSMLREMEAWYKYLSGEIKDKPKEVPNQFRRRDERQLLEEMTGKGFYSPHKETHYLKNFDME